MGKRKRAYTSKEHSHPAFVLSGRVFLQEEGEMPELEEGFVKGDLVLYQHSERSEHTQAMGRLDETGYAGYFKVEVYDGRDWKLVLAQEFFSDNEHKFTKKERPIDTYYILEEILQSYAGTMLTKTYREHYKPLWEE